MNSLIQHFLTLSNPKQIFDLDVSDFLNLPFNAYLKDKKGKILASNDSNARDAGFTKGADIFGLTDFDFAWSKEAATIKENDDRVRVEGKAFSFIEKGCVHGRLCRYASLKAPLLCNSNKIIGIIGLSFFLEEVKPLKIPFPELSKQQLKCLYYLARGMTMKEIAQTLGLSPKTVEHYLSTIKTKLNCESRSELVLHAINAGLLQLIL